MVEVSLHVLTIACSVLKLMGAIALCAFIAQDTCIIRIDDGQRGLCEAKGKIAHRPGCLGVVPFI
jgi:hypothetical protein